MAGKKDATLRAKEYLRGTSAYKEVEEMVTAYEGYFYDNLVDIDTELEKSIGYRAIIDKQLDELIKEDEDGTNRGAKRYINETLENAVALQSQTQSLLKDRFAIKKTILDIALKNQKDETGGNDVVGLLQKYLTDEAKVKLDPSLIDDVELPDID